MSNNRCEINVQLGEKILFASNPEQEKQFTADQEEHYLTCTHPQCVACKKFLVENNLFQMNEEQQAIYDAKQIALEKAEDKQVHKQ